MTLATFLCIVALVIGAIEVVKSNGKSFLAWAVVCLAVALVFPLLKGL